MPLDNKTKKAIELLSNGQLSKAIQMLKKFRLGITKAEKRIIELTYEFQNPKQKKFYTQLGISFEDTLTDFCEIVNRIWLKDSHSKIAFTGLEIETLTNNTFDAFLASRVYLERKNINIPLGSNETIQKAYEIENEERFGGTASFMNFINNN